MKIESQHTIGIYSESNYNILMVSDSETESILEYRYVGI